MRNFLAALIVIGIIWFFSAYSITTLNGTRLKIAQEETQQVMIKETQETRRVEIRELQQTERIRLQESGLTNRMMISQSFNMMVFSTVMTVIVGAIFLLFLIYKPGR